uniref:Uncharacterized protein n=1 Tax=Lygus hesperus TaxID=30085 RepID=A0A146KQY9_LYGHE
MQLGLNGVPIFDFWTASDQEYQSLTRRYLLTLTQPCAYLGHDIYCISHLPIHRKLTILLEHNTYLVLYLRLIRCFIHVTKELQFYLKFSKFGHRTLLLKKIIQGYATISGYPGRSGGVASIFWRRSI